MVKSSLSAQIEALLFIYGEPMPYEKLSQVLGASKLEVSTAIQELAGELRSRNGVVWLVHDSNKVQLTTKPEFSGLLEQIVKEDLKEDLSPASLETLSVIAYAAPISRA